MAEYQYGPKASERAEKRAVSRPCASRLRSRLWCSTLPPPPATEADMVVRGARAHLCKRLGQLKCIGLAANLAAARALSIVNHPRMSLL